MTARDRERIGVIVDVLALEYQTLRTEILALSAHRYQIPTVAATAAALLIGFAPKDSVAPTWVVIALAPALLLIALTSWARSGTFIMTLSVRLSQIENRINAEAAAAFDPPVDDLLCWETMQTSHHAGPWWRFLKGPVTTATPRR